VVPPPNAGGPPRAARAGGGGRPRLRVWQAEALARFEASEGCDFLAVATPGAGKTTFALTAVRRALLAGRARRFVVVVPTQHLKQQWAHAAEAFGLHVDPDWSPGYGALPSDVHGVAVTYQQVAANPGAIRALVGGSVAVLDEIHHAGESRAWGDAVRAAFAACARRLCLSGTPFRSDESTIPYVRYNGEEAVPDYEYGYGQALEEGGVVRPVFFPCINGHMEWTAPGGLDCAATFDDPLTRELANQRLRTALNIEGEWMPAVLEQAHAQLMHLRARDAGAAGLVVAMDQAHAYGIAEMMRERLKVLPTVATSDDPAASQKISEFTAGRGPWIVAVRMVSEGVDIPRLRVGVYATHTVTDLFFRQAVGRLVRWTGGRGRRGAYMFIPGDARLRTFAAEIAQQRRNCRKIRGFEGDGPEGGEVPDGRELPTEREEPADGQLSLFAPISAVPLDDQGRRLDTIRVFGDEHDHELGDESDAGSDGDAAGAHGDDAAAIPAGSFAPGSAAASAAAAEQDPVPLHPADAPAAIPGVPPQPVKAALARRRELREQNSEAVAEFARARGKSHAEVNADLNRRVGIRRISEATVRQLERRLDLALKLLRR
jgi:superfamily II DNA or RNA helicase